MQRTIFKNFRFVLLMLPPSKQAEKLLSLVKDLKIYTDMESPVNSFI